MHLTQELRGSDPSIGLELCNCLWAYRTNPTHEIALIAALAIPVQAYSGISPWLRRKFGMPAVAPTFDVKVEVPGTSIIREFIGGSAFRYT